MKNPVRRCTVIRMILTCPTLLMLSAMPSAQAAPSPAREWNEQLMASIRLNQPNPPAHARNLFHTAVAIYDAWAAYNTTAVGYIYNEKVAVMPPTAPEVAAARRETISYAAYRVLWSRFKDGFNGTTIVANARVKLTAMGYSFTTAEAATTNDATPAELGKRIGQAILTWGAGDGFSLSAYPQAYNDTINTNLSNVLSVLGDNAAFPTQHDMPLGYGIPAATDPNMWQPLLLSVIVDQFGNPFPGGVPQGFVGVQSLATTPFSLTRSDATKPWLDPFGGPSRLSTPGNPSATDASYKANAMDVLRKSAKLNDNTLVNISPGAYGNNDLGQDNGTGYTENPVTHLPYAVNNVKRSDFVRVLAEFWADGPNSETPPGHWHVLANEVSDDPALVKKIRGQGPVLDDLEWDVKVYFALSAATHDAACAAWALKRYYSGTRPITMIRYMGSKGQSSDPNGPSYNSQGLPLEPGVVEVITAATTVPGGTHELVWDVSQNAYVAGSTLIGQVAVYSWPGEDPNNLPAPSIATHQSLVRWQLAKDWLPFQRKTFNTPAFPGYISGHSSFSRSAAEALTLLTGSSDFPGGFHDHTVLANTMQIDLGPSTNVTLQWRTFYDAADQAGQSRRWGGIHPFEDDYHGRRIGSTIGKQAFALAEKYWTGEILKDSLQPSVTVQGNGTALLKWTPTRGMYHKVQTSTNPTTGWTDATTAVLYRDNGAISGDPVGSYTDATPLPGRKFYRIARSFTP